MSLTEWTITFLRNKDIIRQQLVSVEEKGHVVHAVYKREKKQDSFCYETLDDLSDILSAAKKSDADSNYSINIVCYNTQHNLALLILHWQQFASHQRLMFYFVNPNSQTDTKWILNPWLHNRISDPKNLATGLKSMFSMVEEWKG